ncbi:MAG TPA: sugar phosphate isomerase/epimerase family protein [Candidatus Hydrogenedentes bacterium]|nr:sugar phosphate isomerase/epimerase family protein [Candidatus Hydrogenedentota bacterium]
MFKLAAFTDEISQDLAHACGICADFDAGGAEIRGVWDTNVSDLSDDEVDEVYRIIQDHGMTVCSIASPFGKCELEDAEAWNTHLDILRRCADIAHALDCSLVRGFVFWGHGRLEKPWDAIFRVFEEVPAILEANEIVLGVENEAACYVGTAAHLRYFLDQMNCDRMKSLWDPANHVQDPEGTRVPIVPDAYGLVKPDLVHVHMKDASPAPDGSVPNVFLGEGICQWREQLRALKEDGYEGYVSLETHVDPDDFPAGMMTRYGKYLTGEGREGASKVCLAWARDAMQALG